MKLYEILVKLAKAFIYNSYINEESCSTQAKTRKRKISHILETEPTHAIEYNKKKCLHCKIQIPSIYLPWPKCKKEQESFAHVAWEPVVQRASPNACSGKM